MNINTYIGQVVRILSDISLIIDVGSDRISVGEKIQVFEILDNVIGVKGENLGPLTYVKAELRVKRTEDKYSICETPTHKVSTNPSLSGIFSQNSTVEKHYKLEVDPASILPMKPKNNQIRIGDFVKLAK